MRAPAYLIPLLASVCAWMPAPAHAAAPIQRPKDKPAATLTLFPGNLTQARAHAAERNVPIVAVVLLDEESDNVAARQEMLASPEFAALSERSVLFFSNQGQHPQAEIVEEIDGEKRKRSICGTFRTGACKQHQQHWDEIYNTYSEEGELRCPQVLVLAPDGKLEERIAPGLKPEISSLIEVGQRVQTKLGRGLDEATLARCKAAQARAVKAELAGETGAAFLAFAEVLEISPDGARAVAAKAGQQRAKESFAKLRDASEKKLALDTRLEGYRELEALAKQWDGTEQAAEITRILRRAEKDPLLKDALAKAKREDEARVLWDEAQAAMAAKQPKVVEKKVRLLLRKYAGTQAYEKAAKAHPEWVPPNPEAK